MYLTIEGNLTGMGMEKLLFIQHSNISELEADMKKAKQKFPLLQILFVIINRKGDPAYGIICFYSFTYA